MESTLRLRCSDTATVAVAVDSTVIVAEVVKVSAEAANSKEPVALVSIIDEVGTTSCEPNGGNAIDNVVSGRDIVVDDMGFPEGVTGLGATNGVESVDGGDGLDGLVDDAGGEIGRVGGTKGEA